MHLPTAIALLVLGSACLAAEPNRLVANLAAGTKQTIICYGTSLTADSAWVSQFRAVLDKRYPGLATVVNSGFGGKWSGWGRDNLDERVIARHPDAVFIEFAINDAFLDYKISVDQAKANLVDMITRIQAARPACGIILMTMNPPTGNSKAKRAPVEPYYQMYRDVAKERKLLLIDHYVLWKKLLDESPAEFAKLVPDGIHPSPQGSERVTTPSLLAGLGLAEPGK